MDDPVHTVQGKNTDLPLMITYYYYIPPNSDSFKAWALCLWVEDFNLKPTLTWRSKPSFTFEHGHLLVLFLLAGLAKVKPAVKIVSPVKNQIIRYRNESLLFNCTVTAPGRVNRTNFEWMLSKNGNPYEPLAVKTESSYWSSFELKKGLQLGDEGVYKCRSGMWSDAVEVHLAGKVSILIFSKHYSSAQLTRSSWSPRWDVQ